MIWFPDRVSSSIDRHLITRIHPSVLCYSADPLDPQDETASSSSGPKTLIPNLPIYPYFPTALATQIQTLTFLGIRFTRARSYLTTI